MLSDNNAAGRAVAIPAVDSRRKKGVLYCGNRPGTFLFRITNCSASQGTFHHARGKSRAGARAPVTWVPALLLPPACSALNQGSVSQTNPQGRALIWATCLEGAAASAACLLVGAQNTGCTLLFDRMYMVHLWCTLLWCKCTIVGCRTRTYARSTVQDAGKLGIVKYSFRCTPVRRCTTLAKETRCSTHSGISDKEAQNMTMPCAAMNCSRQ